MSALNLQASEDGVVLKLIPDDVMYSIMLKLPNKSLVRFLLLSKQWKSVITSKQFSQQRKMISSKSSDGIILSACNGNGKKGVRFNAHLISGSHDRQALPAVELWHPCPHQARENCQVWHFLFLGDGLVGDCFHRSSGIDCEYSLVIWNPLTGQHKKVPPPEGEDQTKPPTLAGLGYDATIDDYKIVLVFDARVMVRALNCDDEWRKVHFVPSDKAWFQCEAVAVAVDGDIWWIARRSSDKSFILKKFCLAEGKLFTVTWPPKSRPNIYIHHPKLFSHEDSLHLIEFGLSKVFNIKRRCNILGASVS